jgi:hypothetical protein
MKCNVDSHVPDKKCYKPEHRKWTNYNSIALFVSTVRRYLTAVLAQNYEIFDTTYKILNQSKTNYGSTAPFVEGLRILKLSGKYVEFLLVSCVSIIQY